MIIRGSTRLQRQFRDGVGATQVHDLVFAVTANELAQENKYKELLRGPDHQERTINSNYNRWNPCVTAEVSVDVTNDGEHWRGLGVSASLHAIDATRVHQTRSWVVSFRNLRPFRTASRNTALRVTRVASMASSRPRRHASRDVTPSRRHRRDPHESAPRLSSDVPRRSTQVLTSAYALLVEPTEKYVNQKTHPRSISSLPVFDQCRTSSCTSTSGSLRGGTLSGRRLHKNNRAGTWAVLTYVRQDRWVADEDSLNMDIKRCSHFLVREEGNHSREEGWYLLRGLESAMLSFDFRHLPNELVYDEHYRLAIFVRPSRGASRRNAMLLVIFWDRRTRYGPCRQPIHLSNWFQDPSTPKNVLFNMTLIALDDVIFKIEVHILNGMWLPAVDFFREQLEVASTAVQIGRHPVVARHLRTNTRRTC